MISKAVSLNLVASMSDQGHLRATNRSWTIQINLFRPVISNPEPMEVDAGRKSTTILLKYYTATKIVVGTRATRRYCAAKSRTGKKGVESRVGSSGVGEGQSLTCGLDWINGAQMQRLKSVAGVGGVKIK